MTAFHNVARFLEARWKVWIPPVLLTIAVFVGLMLFVHGKKLAIFTYKIF
jgi:hypothetical protein